MHITDAIVSLPLNEIVDEIVKRKINPFTTIISSQCCINFNVITFAFSISRLDIVKYYMTINYETVIDGIPSILDVLMSINYPDLINTLDSNDINIHVSYEHIYDALARHDVELAKYIMCRIDPKSGPANQRFAMSIEYIICVQLGHEDLCLSLLKWRGENIRFGKEILCYASYKGWKRVVDKLLGCGIDCKSSINVTLPGGLPQDWKTCISISQSQSMIEEYIG